MLGLFSFLISGVIIPDAFFQELDVGGDIYFIHMTKNELRLDEIWQDFYRTLHMQDFENAGQADRKKLIYIAWLYDFVAQSGTNKPVEVLAKQINCTVEEAGAMVNQCIEARLLCLPKRGSFRCQLSVNAVKMIAKFRIGAPEN